MITNARQEFLAAHVLPEAKANLKREAEERTNGSISKLIHLILVERYKLVEAA